MSHFPHGAFVAIHASREQHRQEQLEEEEMTRYSTDELEDNWEFKIVRSQSGAFRKSEVFQTLLQEESIAGWELVEKLDDRRVRFKRPRDARRHDAALPPGIDPYRSHYGNPTAQTALVVGIGLMIALMVAFGVIGFSAVEGQPLASIVTIFPIIIVLGVFTLMIALIFLRRR
jgi:hypothetical protein